MIIIGIIIFSLAVAIWMYCYLSLNTTRGNTPLIAYYFGILLYLVPIGLGIIGILMAKWYALIGVPFGLALFSFIIGREFRK